MATPNEPSHPVPHKGTVSRRGFLKGAGITAAGTMVLDTGLAEIRSPETDAPEARVLGPGPIPVTLRVNGRAYQVPIEPRMTLADVLRNGLYLTGTKVVCDRGACSACTVWLDKEPVCSCLTLAVEVTGREITTIEGLAHGEELHPVQAAFIEHDAAMCGFCTPGMVMSCAALLERQPNPTLDDVKAATSGHLCRCGTYPKVFAATLAVAQPKKQP